VECGLHAALPEAQARCHLLLAGLVGHALLARRVGDAACHCPVEHGRCRWGNSDKNLVVLAERRPACRCGVRRSVRQGQPQAPPHPIFFPRSQAGQLSFPHAMPEHRRFVSVQRPLTVASIFRLHPEKSCRIPLPPLTHRNARSTQLLR